MRLKERVILLKKTKYSESDLILHGISETGEKLGFLAKGALKSKHRFSGGVLELSHFVELTLTPQKNKEGRLRLIQEANLLRGFDGIRESYEKLDVAWHMLECVYRVSQEGDQHSSTLYNLLGHSLSALETTKSPGILRTQFQLKLLYQQGVIHPERWMLLALKTSIKDHAFLSKEWETLEARRDSIEGQVSRYLRSAELGFAR